LQSNGGQIIEVPSKEGQKVKFPPLMMTVALGLGSFLCYFLKIYNSINNTHFWKKIKINKVLTLFKY
jgi:hypothetical protein